MDGDLMYAAVFGNWSSPASAVPPVTPPTGGATDNVAVAVRAMKQVAVLWRATGTPDEYGRPTYEEPEAITCRWEEVNEEFIAPNGDRELSKAKLIVDRDIDVKSMVWLGELDSTVPDDPTDQDDAWEVQQFSNKPDFKGRKFLRQVYL